MLATFTEFKGGVQINLEMHPRSIFDTNIAGQTATDDEYYTICRDHITNEIYAVVDYFGWVNEIGLYTLEEDSNPTQFNGEWVRPMTYYEEELWNQDLLTLNIDAKGNVEYIK